MAISDSDMDAAVAALPSFNATTANPPERQALRATGTDNLPVDIMAGNIPGAGTRAENGMKTKGKNTPFCAATCPPESDTSVRAQGPENPIKMRISGQLWELGRAGIEPATQGFSVLCSTN